MIKNQEELLKNTIINKILYNYYKKYKKLPAYGRSLVVKNIKKKGDMLDYIVDTKEGYIYINYTYYEKASDENKYIINSFKLCKE